MASVMKIRIGLNVRLNVRWVVVTLACLVASAWGADVNYYVQEESPPGSLVGNIPESLDLATLVSQASLPSMRYSFLNTDSAILNRFALDPKTGVLRLSTRGVLDREAICPYDVACVLELQIAIQSTQTQFFRKVLVAIDVIDINDFAPQFKENRTTLTISESVQIPSSFPLPSAVDRDTGVNNSLQSYEIVPQDGPFEISYSTENANLMLKVVKELDHETQAKYSIRIIAKDGGSPPREGVLFVDVLIEDVNDNPPVFTQENYAKVVDEKVTQGSVLLTLTATDADSGKNGQVRYGLSRRQPASVLTMFSINDKTGELRLVGDLQNADVELYKIDVEASDMGDQPFTTKTTVTITVEDTINRPPKIVVSYLSNNNYSSVSEYANLGVAVAHILVRDTDRGPNGIIQCNMSTAGASFELQSYDVKEYKVIVAKPLDRETVSVHDITVGCSDSGLPPLSTSQTFQVKVTDENDNAPEFKEKRIAIGLKENSAAGQQIAQVTAVDSDDPDTGNGRVTYRLTDVSDGEFIIHSNTGTIKVMTSFDYEKRREINFTVVAEDNGVPKRSSKLSVTVNILDVNDEAPHFAQNRFSIAVSENTEPGLTIGEITATDSEDGPNGQIEITLIPGSGRTRRNLGDPKESAAANYEGIDDSILPFQIRPNGSLILAAPVDYEKLTSYELEVVVRDKGAPPLSSTATVVIDVRDENDNAPQVLHPNVSEIVFTALTGADSPKTLMTFEVVDRDSGNNGRIVFTITARNDSGRFDVDQASGDVQRTRGFTGKDSGTYKLSVMIRDSGTPPLYDVRTLLVHVIGGNSTGSGTGTSSDQYIVIALTLVCITILLSVTIVLVIVIMRRLDRRRKTPGSPSGGPMQFHNTRVVSEFVDPIKMDNFRNEQDDPEYGGEEDGSGDKKKMDDYRFGFTSSSGSINKSNSAGDSSYQSNPVNNLNLPTSVSSDGDMDLGALQLHQVLLQTYHDTQSAGAVPEDGASDSSGETITSDSGRGGSDEDISTSNIMAGNLMDESRGHNGSFHSNTSTFCPNASLKSSVKDPVRCSSRKHVTFKDMERFRNSIRSQTAALTNGNDLTQPFVVGPQQTTLGAPATGNVGARSSQQTQLSEMNIPVPRDNSNVRADHTGYNSFAGHTQIKTNLRGGLASPICMENHGRDSPKLVTFQTAAAAPSHQPFQNLCNPRLPLYSPEDNIPSPMPRESQTEWKGYPRAPAQQPYAHMTPSPRDRAVQQQSSHRAQSPFSLPNAAPHGESTVSRAPAHVSGPRTQDSWADFHNNINTHRDNSLQNQRSSSSSKISAGLLSPRLQSPAPVVPPRGESAAHRDVHSLSQPSLLLLLPGSDGSKYQTNGQYKVADHLTMLSRDWTNESIATTEDGDDQRSTTTSGSYTIDNDEEYLAMEYKPKDIVV